MLAITAREEVIAQNAKDLAALLVREYIGKHGVHRCTEREQSDGSNHPQG